MHSVCRVCMCACVCELYKFNKTSRPHCAAQQKFCCTHEKTKTIHSRTHTHTHTRAVRVCVCASNITHTWHARAHMSVEHTSRSLELWLSHFLLSHSLCSLSLCSLSLSASFVGQPTRRNVTCVSFAMFLFRLVLSRCALLSLPLKTRSVSLARPLSRLQRAA